MNNNKPFLVLFEPEIPQNVGSIIRLCACLKTKLVIIRPCAFIWDTSKLKRSAMDYYNECEIIFFNEFKEFKEQHEGRILGTCPKLGKNYSNVQYEKNDAILMGKESTGLPEIILEQTNELLTIPIYSRSLNLAISSAILISNALIKFD